MLSRMVTRLLWIPIREIPGARISPLPCPFIFSVTSSDPKLSWCSKECHEIPSYWLYFLQDVIVCGIWCHWGQVTSPLGAKLFSFSPFQVLLAPVETRFPIFLPVFFTVCATWKKCIYWISILYCNFISFFGKICRRLLQPPKRFPSWNEKKIPFPQK